MKKGLKAFLISIVFILVSTMITGLFLQVFLPEGKKVTDWFNKEEQEIEEPSHSDEEKHEENESLVATIENYTTLLSLSTMVAEASESGESIIITATVKPENATNKKVDFNVNWNDPNSGWANGKSVNDYITLVPVSDGSSTATVTAVQPFAEKIVVTVVSRDNAQIKATCTLDYRKRLTSLNAYCINCDDFEGEVSNFYIFQDETTNYVMAVSTLDECMGDEWDRLNYCFDKNFTVGTLSGDVNYSLYVDFTDDMETIFNSYDINTARTRLAFDDDYSFEFKPENLSSMFLNLNFWQEFSNNESNLIKALEDIGFKYALEFFLEDLNSGVSTSITVSIDIHVNVSSVELSEPNYVL